MQFHARPTPNLQTCKPPTLQPSNLSPDFDRNTIAEHDIYRARRPNRDLGRGRFRHYLVLRGMDDETPKQRGI
jgi:hypothetical protein